MVKQSGRLGEIHAIHLVDVVRVLERALRDQPVSLPLIAD
jgi:hypothetical protein